MPRRDTRSELKVSHKATMQQTGNVLLNFDKYHSRYDLPNMMDRHLPKRTELHTESLQKDFLMRSPSKCLDFSTSKGRYESPPSHPSRF